jgi:hypothetical protein
MISKYYPVGARRYFVLGASIFPTPLAELEAAYRDDPRANDQTFTITVQRRIGPNEWSKPEVLESAPYPTEADAYLAIETYEGEQRDAEELRPKQGA